MFQNINIHTRSISLVSHAGITPGTRYQVFGTAVPGTRYVILVPGYQVYLVPGTTVLIAGTYTYRVYDCAIACCA